MIKTETIKKIIREHWSEVWLTIKDRSPIMRRRLYDDTIKFYELRLWLKESETICLRKDVMLAERWQKSAEQTMTAMQFRLSALLQMPLRNQTAQLNAIVQEATEDRNWIAYFKPKSFDSRRLDPIDRVDLEATGTIGVVEMVTCTVAMGLSHSTPPEAVVGDLLLAIKNFILKQWRSQSLLLTPGFWGIDMK